MLSVSDILALAPAIAHLLRHLSKKAGKPLLRLMGSGNYESEEAEEIDKVAIRDYVGRMAQTWLGLPGITVRIPMRTLPDIQLIRVDN
ncbi:hypothetical protein PG993_011565 [Apiospora rasikravindrae]|uniref:Uncharacterized protein n=1 Tax=Apiospora rasikravindrae TaxID=990691 RepID=A0ABR1RZZ5_9PEZI